MTRNRHLPRDSDGTLSSYAWPGGYPIIYLDHHDSVLCPDCAERFDKDPDADERDRPVHSDVFWEGAPMECDECGAMMESAYGDPDSEET
jgi:hypothetical protein